MIKDFEPRLYQQTILATCIEKNTLVILPTGLGKTNIFLMLSSHVLGTHPDKKILFLGPTKPLVSQYYDAFARNLDIDKAQMAVFTGNVRPEKRAELWKSSRIIFSTPQGLENDVINGNINLEDVSLLGFDEAHRAVGDYSYVWLASQYVKKSPKGRIIGLTASPGSDLESITTVCSNLFIEAVEVRTEEDPDVKQYLHEVKIKWIYVTLPQTFLEVKKFLDDCFRTKVEEIKRLAVVELQSGDLSKKDILALQGRLQSEIISGNRQPEILRSVSIASEMIKVQHMLELLETQGIHSLSEFMEDIVARARSSETKAVRNLAADLNFRSALVKTRTLGEMRIEHPKLAELKTIIKDTLSKKSDAKIIVFSQYRDSLTKLLSEVSKMPGVKAKMFVGQAKRKGTGLSQKEQIAMLREFESGDFNVILMSSVGEEGLDIPSVNLVVFYEPIPSAIRTIQRKGRTGRHEEGEVIVLVTKGTRDEAFRWSAFRKQKSMYSVLETIREKFSAAKRLPEEKPDFCEGQEVIVYCDFREKANPIIKSLIEKGIKVKLESLEIGDYLLSSRVCAEFKTVPDFVDSIIDKRLLSQAKELKRYEKPVLIVEGSEDIYSQRNLHPNAILGMIAAITIDFGIPIIMTKNSDETSMLLASIAKREQCDLSNREFTLHSMKPQSLREQQEYIISGLPGVGPILSKPLLKRFGSVKNVINASEDELKEVDLIGEKKAKKIKEVFDSPYP